MTTTTGPAPLDAMERLHKAVAEQLAKNLMENPSDPKTLSMVLAFLKDNSVKTEVLQSDAQQSLSEAIKRIAQEKDKEMTSVEALMGLSNIN